MLGALTFLSLGCAPPDAPLGSLPEIRLIYPSDSSVLDAFDAGDGSCTVHTFIAVDILNFDFVPPAAGQEVVEGQGHYHVDGGANSTNRPQELYLENGEFLGAPCPENEKDTSKTLRIRAYLVNAAHEDINDTDEHEDFAEPQLRLVDAPKDKDTGGGD
jgi:hypothetical protein